MDLEDLIDDKGLKQNEWSLTSPTFGNEGQLKVVGWSGSDNGRHRLYVLLCNKCSQDSELFGDGYFRSTKYNLLKGAIPCGCAVKPRWSKRQFSILCQRSSESFGYKFLGFVGDWKGAFTKTKMLCEKHGEWESGNINNLANNGTGCPGCKADTVGESSTKPDEVIITSFFASGAFHPDTKFWRSDRKTKQGSKSYWYMYCPDCKQTGESFIGDLQLGGRSCNCSRQRQQEAYINLLIDDHNNPVAIKFGIAIDSKQRIKNQNRQSVYTINQHSIYIFPSVKSCKQAERDCKEKLECGVVLKRDMPDGYSETTWVYNLEKIIEIYELNGGIER
ncbi:endonuclease [Pseudomonas phage vB_PsaM_M1]|nr:endonuclease [Pseudomonas phage vB_PsaM_M1]